MVHGKQRKNREWPIEQKSGAFFAFARVSLIRKICNILKGYGSLFTSLIFERVIVFIEKLCQLVTKFVVLFAEIKISL